MYFDEIGNGDGSAILTEQDGTCPEDREAVALPGAWSLEPGAKS